MISKAEKNKKIDYIRDSINVSARVAKQLLNHDITFCSFCKQISDESVHFRIRKRLLYAREDLPLERRDFIWESMMGDRK